MQQLSTKVFKLSFEYLYAFIAQKVAIFAEKITKLRHYVLSKSDLWKILKYSQSRNLEGIQ